MTLKPILRRSGSYLVTMRLEFHLGEEQLIGGLVLEFWRPDEDPPATISKAQFEKRLRQRIANRGDENVTYWTDDMLDDQQDAARAWARKVLHEMYPEFA